MNRNYIILAVIAIALAIGILFMGDNVGQGNSSSKIQKVSDRQSRYVTVDQVTDRLIKGDPSIMLIDVRPSEQFKKFAIPEAINIPADSLLTASSLELLKQKGIDKVLYSNADIWSNHAWLQLNQREIGSIFVLRGGANEWYRCLFKSEEPPATASNDAQNVYSFHKAAFQHFYGNKISATADGNSNTSASKAPKSVPLMRQQPSASSGGGC